jgi:hypothetical protein
MEETLVESVASSDTSLSQYVIRPRSSFHYPKFFAWIGATLASWGMVIGLARLVLALIP